MAIEKLVICDWYANKVKSTEVDNPTWEQVKGAILSLNEGNLNDIYLHPRKNENETYLCIGGGNNRYVITGSIENREFPTFKSGESEKEIILMVGGQESGFPENAVHSIETTLSKVKLFYNSGGFECGVTWESI